ncbi:hypothetical protein DYU11_15570 [Fibrisoma montanum]|uniref:Secretion system C-terminal sorting domain-containing protein n=1 Tax=Fibrisoma montanum TaxID=2305895 RepID=A0A418M8M5_9BACT|nr:hypothetical protein [Fibrisoma montanum]RIV22433.1 hypothetical protein DYU11_15570 [Fibrisoma montanum]
MFNFLLQASALVGAKSILGAVLLSASTLTTEPAEPKKPASFGASAYVNKENKIQLSVEKVVAEPVTVVLRNQNNQVLFTQRLGKKQNKFSVKFDMSELQDGAYELEISSSDGSIRKQVSLQTNTVTLEQPRLITMQ